VKDQKAFPFFSSKEPRVCGHRGAAGVAPESTLISFKRALEDGADYLELDVQEDRDGNILILHDSTLQRTTNGKGKVKRWSLNDLKGLDAGYWFTQDGGRSYPYRGQQIGIPTLEEFFSALPQARAIVEIKRAGSGMVQKLVDTVLRYGKEDQLLLASEKDDIMDQVRAEIARRDLRMPTGLSYGEIRSFMNWVWAGRNGAFESPGQALQIPCTYAGWTLITDQTVQAAHDVGLEVHAWTINDTDEMKRLLDLGVDGIVTDYPSRLRDLRSLAL
jgi:glycerophosphoryl diester phosphodiesterase